MGEVLLRQVSAVARSYATRSSLSPVQWQPDGRWITESSQPFVFSFEPLPAASAGSLDDCRPFATRRHLSPAIR